MTNKSCGGSPNAYNLLLIDEERHNTLHKIFGNLNLYEIIVLLIRVCRAKHYEKENQKITKFYKLVKNETGTFETSLEKEDES